MKELRLQVNTLFYCVLATLSVVLLSLAKLFFDLQLSQIAVVQFFIAMVATLAVSVHFILALSGQKCVTICNQGLSHFNIFGRRKFIPSEEITRLTTKSFLGLKAIQIHTEEKRITLLAFKISKKQKKTLQQLGYLA
ncbi:hypothetical protein N474_19840 [Pseudoalteromonas luteoviolacea CPMOR-2]|uniref:hypothetical protein n=1 Tax=Pseudoalteromonas luteoviolacea TaxID=43657 RepID=UPI0007B056BE|nr:hypothetical protein [Pseudoalteromonas luteoviolacea]KZN53587.1 hypothetical protein N474_19840 [Pseudoalteromonas luteoviolacea CPMOR-2]